MAATTFAFQYMLAITFSFLEAWALVAIYFAILWFIADRRGEADLVDAGWAFGIAGLAIWFALTGDGYGPRKFLGAALIAIWGSRLGLYLLFDRVLKPGEDGRYQSLRAKWGAKARINFFIFFQLQGFLVVLLSIPAYVISQDPTIMLRPGDVFGVIIWLVALLGESTADFQLAGFRADAQNKGRTCRIGLWRYSRHPNYFFEWLHWWAYVFVGGDAMFSFLLFLNPLVLFYLITQVTGIPPTEARALASRGDDYREYQRTTSPFFPWPTRSKVK